MSEMNEIVIPDDEIPTVDIGTIDQINSNIKSTVDNINKVVKKFGKNKIMLKCIFQKVLKLILKL